MSFHEVRFPVAVSFGSSGGPERRTEVVTLANGAEHRSTAWAHGHRRYDAGIGLRSLDDIHETLAFFEARRGRLYGFRWRDWTDHKSCRPSRQPAPGDCALGEGDGIVRSFLLIKSYRSGSETYRRPIAKPVAGSVRVAVDGAELPADDFTVDSTSGVVTLGTAPKPGAAVTAGFAFDVPVRFDTDRIEVNLAAFEAGAIPSIPIVEIRV
jgi:uncharacterized protein (TIGR02217 family)